MQQTGLSKQGRPRCCKTWHLIRVYNVCQMSCKFLDTVTGRPSKMDLFKVNPETANDNSCHLLCHLLVILSHFCKQCGPRSDCSFMPVCKNRFEKFARIFSRQHKQTTFSNTGFLGVLRVKNKEGVKVSQYLGKYGNIWSLLLTKQKILFCHSPLCCRRAENVYDLYCSVHFG